MPERIMMKARIRFGQTSLASHSCKVTANGNSRSVRILVNVPSVVRNQPTEISLPPDEALRLIKELATALTTPARE